MSQRYFTKLLFYEAMRFGWKDDYVSTMPVPKLVFGSLARAWREISGEDNIHSVEEYAEQNLIFGTFELSTHAVTLHNKTQLGAVGRFEYLRTDKTDQPLARGLNLLADLAFYSGLGRKTPQGMGQVSRLVR
jgi:CRISPR-associated endoribonuclease Cas6